MSVTCMDIANGEQNSTVIVRETTTGTRSGVHWTLEVQVLVNWYFYGEVYAFTGSIHAYQL